MKPSDSKEVREALEKLKNRWPSNGDVYHYLTSGDFRVDSDVWVGSRLDRKREGVGNVFRSSIKAQEVRKRVLRELSGDPRS